MMSTFKERLEKLNPLYIKFDALHTLQLNLGNLCNQSCRHCHQHASPHGTRIMSREVIDKVIAFLSRQSGVCLDITGGCPELHPLFRFLMEKTRELSPRRLVRSNLTVIVEPGMEWLPEFYRANNLVVVASLPCYSQINVNRQRGEGVFEKSIAALKRLNEIGYGDALELDLVYNPGDAFLPGPQADLEATYKEKLFSRYGIVFNNLFTITNAPIGRFKEHLVAGNAYDSYLQLLSSRFNPETAGNIMCRRLFSLDWQGVLYNCDFNQAAGLPVTDEEGEILNVDNLEEAVTAGMEIFLAQHCYSCTAGEGSSCSGALSLQR